MTNWQKHTGTEFPAELAGSQIVEAVEFADDAPPQSGFERVDSIPWDRIGVYRPALDDDGIPYCSAEGLESWAEYVATDEDGDIVQYRYKPVFEHEHDAKKFWGPGLNNSLDPQVQPQSEDVLDQGFRKPGDPSDSLMRVWRD